jgi:hypothetical protein
MDIERIASADWQSMATFPPLTDEEPFEAMHPYLGVCRVQWLYRALIAKVTPPTGKDFFLHSTGNGQGYPAAQTTFTKWRTLRP